MTVIFVVSTIIIFLSIDWLVRRLRAHPVQAPVRRASRIRTPDGIFFSKSHTWVSLFPSGKIRIGVDDFITRLLSKPEIIFMKRTGDIVEKGDPLIRLKEGGHTLTVRAPVSGTVLAANEALSSDPGLLKDRLFSDGWTYIVRPRSAGEVKELFVGSETRVWMHKELQRLRDLFAIGLSGDAVPAFMQDGGMPAEGALDAMDDAMWQQVDHEFLDCQ